MTPPSSLLPPPSSIRASRALCSLFIASLFIASCVPSGVADLDSAGQRAVVVSEGDVYVLDRDTAAVEFYARRPDVRYTPALAPDGQSLVYVDQLHQLVSQPLNGGPPTVLIKSVGLPGPGAVTFLPDGQVLVIDSSSAAPNERYAAIVNPFTGNEAQGRLTGIDQVFITASALKIKTGPLTNPYNSARIDTGEPGQFKAVFEGDPCLITERTCLYLYSAEADGFKFVEQLGRALDVSFLLLLSRRPSDDVTGALLTADGKHLVLRVRDGNPIGSTFSLYAIDLTNNEAPAILVQNALRRPDYAIAPEGNLVAYEEVSGNVASIKLYDFDSKQTTTLGTGAFDPQWWR